MGNSPPILLNLFKMAKLAPFPEEQVKLNIFKSPVIMVLVCIFVTFELQPPFLFH